MVIECTNHWANGRIMNNAIWHHHLPDLLHLWSTGNCNVISDQALRQKILKEKTVGQLSNCSEKEVT